LNFQFLITFFLTSLFIYGDSKNIKSLEYQYKLKKYDALRFYFDCSIGNLKIRPSNNRYIVNGDIFYNAEMPKPQLKLSDKNNIARLDFKVKPNSSSASASTLSSLIDKGNDNYKINFKLPTKIATDMNLNFGLGKVDLDFSGIRISSLVMDCGLSDVTLVSKKPNIISCDNIKISTGISDFNSIGLGNFNSSKYTFDVGMGSAEIDMSGSINNNTTVKIEVSVGSLELKLPFNTNINLSINQNMLSSVNVKDLVSTGEGKYESKDYQKRWSSMNIEISVGIGSVDVSTEKK
jgi:hypothetical protein|tara:strand:+ start:210 stop:1085 length:876 start_codon:yes stop_codon:yes gene_type:complete